jgi:hypothetical protein
VTDDSNSSFATPEWRVNEDNGSGRRAETRLADLTDDELLAAAGPGATLEDTNGRTVGHASEPPPIPPDQPPTKRELLTERERELAERYRKFWPWLDSDSGSGRRD